MPIVLKKKRLKELTFKVELNLSLSTIRLITKVANNISNLQWTEEDFEVNFYAYYTFL